MRPCVRSSTSEATFATLLIENNTLCLPACDSAQQTNYTLFERPLQIAIMSLGPAGLQLNPEEADNFEDIEKQFAVKGIPKTQSQFRALHSTKSPNSRTAHANLLVHPREDARLEAPLDKNGR